MLIVAGKPVTMVTSSIRSRVSVNVKIVGQTAGHSARRIVKKSTGAKTGVRGTVDTAGIVAGKLVRRARGWIPIPVSVLVSIKCVSCPTLFRFLPILDDRLKEKFLKP